MAEQESASPKKIRKLDAVLREKSFRQKLFSQDSQESRATSTPSRKTYPTSLSMSTDISSIEPPSDKDYLSPVDTILCSSHIENTTVDTLVRSRFEDLTLRGTSDTSSLLQASRKKYFRGKAWNFLKPKFEETLYYKVLREFDSIEEIADELLNKFRSDAKTTTLEMIKFLIDICGYQSIEIDKYFDFNQNFSNCCEKVIKLLEFDLVNSEILKNNIYVFNEASKKKSKMGTTMAAAINKFLETFFCSAYDRNVLFADFIHKHIFVFIFQMCQSNLRSIRHTGIVLTRSIIGTLNVIFTENEITEQEEQYLKKYIQYFFQLFRKNSLIPDAQLSVLKAENSKNIGVWMVQLPDIYFENCYALLKILILDESGEVRLAVLEVFGKLIKTKNSYVIQNMTNMIQIIKGRMKDINAQVVVKAIKVYTILLDSYRQFVVIEDLYFVGELLFGRSYLYGKAAAFFLLTFFQVSDVDGADQLKKLLKISMTPAFIKMKPLFIEAFSEYETIFQDYDFLFDNLVNSEDSDYANCLIELIHHSIHQELKGKCSIKRENSIQRVPRHADNIKISKALFKSLETIFETFHNNNHVLNYVIKTLSLIDYNALPVSYTMRYVQYTMKHCQTIFYNEHADELSRSICNLLRYLNDNENITPKETLKKFLNALFQEASDRLKNHYMDRIVSPESIEDHFNKIGILFEVFDLSHYFDWNLLFTNWGGVMKCEGQIVACKYFILWGIKDLIDIIEDGDDNKISMKSIFLKTVHSEFTLSLVRVFATKASQATKIEAFKSLCTIHTSSDEILLKEDAHALEEFRIFILENLQTQICDELTTFFKSKLIKNKSVSLEERKLCVTEWLSLVLNGLLDVLHLPHLFESYFKYSEEYGALIQFAAKNIFDTNPQTFFNVILVTLIQNAEDEFKVKKRDVSESIDLLMLAEKFATLPQFTNSSENVYQMIQFGLKFVFKEELFGFLVVLQIFIQKLNKEYLEKCKEVFLNLTPILFENQRDVKYFRNKLLGLKLTIKKSNSTLTDSTLKSKDVSQPKVLKTKVVKSTGNVKKSGKSPKLKPLNEQAKKVSKKTPKSKN